MGSERKMRKREMEQSFFVTVGIEEKCDFWILLGLGSGGCNKGFGFVIK